MREVSNFLAQKKLSGSSKAFLFNSRGEIIAFPDEGKIQRAIKNADESTLVPTTIASLGEPAISALYEAVQKQGDERMMRLDVDGRSYLSQVVPIMRQIGEADYLGIVVPVDEITAPINRIRTDALIYSLPVILLGLPLYITLFFVWLYSRLRWRSFSPSDFSGLDGKD